MKHLASISLIVLVSAIVRAGVPDPQAPPASGQAPAATFRATANFIEIDASVTDATGAFVRGLTADDFEIREDGRPAPIALLSLVDIPVERADRPLYRSTAIEPDVVTNAAVTEGRLYVLVMDSLHVDASRSAIARQQARRFVERYLGANDLAAVVHIGQISAGQEFTASRRLLLASIDQFLGQKLESAAVSSNRAALADQELSADQQIAVPGLDLEGPQRAHDAQVALGTIEQLARGLASVTGRRKALLWFTEGVDYDLTDGPTQIAGGHANVRDAQQVAQAERAMIGAATRANLVLYPVDPRGLATGLEDAMRIGPLPGSTAASEMSMPLTVMADELKRAEQAMRAYAESTGGRALVATNDPDTGFAAIRQDNSSYYVLGYRTPRQDDGRFHSVSVRMKRPGLTVRARRGYYAPASRAAADGAADPLASAMASPLPRAGLGLRVAAAVVGHRGTAGLVHVTLEMSGADLHFEPAPNGLFTGDFEVMYGALDESGHTTASERKDVALSLLAVNRDLVFARGLRYEVDLDLAPGRYQLRLAARDRVTDRAGSIHADVMVPEPGALLFLSDPVLASVEGTRMFTTSPAPTITRQMPGPPTTLRTFPATDRLAVGASVEVADSLRGSTIDLSVTVRTDDGARMFALEDVREGRTLARGAPLLTVFTIPLAGFAPGHYVLTVQARARQGGATLTRDVSFDVR